MMVQNDDFRELVKVLRRALLMIVAWCDAYLRRTEPSHIEQRWKEPAAQ